jgi:hypothetical protein
VGNAARYHDRRVPEAFPPLPDDLVEFAHGGRSALVGTCSRDLDPECMRANGVRIWPGGYKLTIFLPTATAALTVANLRENPRISITLSEIATHRTMQLKGAVLEIRTAPEEDQAYVSSYRELFAADLAWAGQTTANTLALTVWPAYAVDVEIAVVYTQTPGPAAGLQMPIPGVRP